MCVCVCVCVCVSVCVCVHARLVGYEIVVALARGPPRLGRLLVVVEGLPVRGRGSLCMCAHARARAHARTHAHTQEKIQVACGYLPEDLEHADALAVDLAQRPNLRDGPGRVSRAE